jgi:hypothetical protein
MPVMMDTCEAVDQRGIRVLMAFIVILALLNGLTSR